MMATADSDSFGTNRWKKTKNTEESKQCDGI